MTRTPIKIHSEFRLNGMSYSRGSLKTLAFDLVQEGQPFEQKIGNFLSDWLGDRATVEVHTSGSTGTPKVIVLQKDQMVNSALATGKFFNLLEKDSALLCLPAEYIAGKMMLVRAMVLGLHLDYVEPSSNPLITISKNYDFVAMVPLQLEQSIAQIDLIKTLLVGGAAVSSQLKKKLEDKTVTVFESYGMTETITHIAVKKITNSSSMKTSESKKNHFSTLPNVILSKDNRDCLVINAPEICDHKVVTNDIVNLISETSFEWLGRYDNVINSGGIKLFPEQIETKLALLITQPFFVAGIADEALGQKLVLVVEGGSDSDDLSAKMNKTKDLERFEIPKSVYFIPEFVTTENGKIRRAETLKLLQS